MQMLINNFCMPSLSHIHTHAHMINTRKSPNYEQVSVQIEKAKWG